MNSASDELIAADPLDSGPQCGADDHDPAPRSVALDPLGCQRAAEIFRALGDGNRLQILQLLGAGPRCVTEIAAALDEKLPAVSGRLKLLRSQRIVRHQRRGKHVYYALADRHIAELVAAGLAHARETP